MCGIAGLWRPAGLKDSDGISLPRMMDSLSHRGPDGEGSYIDGKRGIAMGHKRLSIIDLSESGSQPLYDRGKSLALTVNGEFYDYKSIRTHLVCEGERFYTKTDSEIALKLYRRHGLSFVDKLRGEFAFALFDADKQRLILVRDRFGIRPLFYHVASDAIYYGSEVKALFQHPEVPKRLSKRAALHQMMQTMVPGTSAFAEISALKPGHMLIVSRRGDTLEVESKRYWDMDFPQQSEHDTDPNPKRYIDTLTDKLIDAVRVRLEADVPVGCYLSGGIDSCSILGLSTPMQQAPVKAFTISFDDDQYDEAAIASQMAKATNADQEVLSIAAQELYGDYYEKTLWHAERTFYNTLSVAKWHMSRRVRDCGFKVVVTGEGSDELFAGYPFFKRDYFLHEDGVSDASAFRAKLEQTNKLFRGAILSEEDVTHPAMQDLCGFTPSWIQPWILTLRQVRPLFLDSIQESLRDYDPIEAIAEQIDASMLRGRHPLDKVQYTWIKTMLEGQILNWGGDRVDMANSMESRPAFLDHHLAEFAQTIPPQLRIRDGVEKWVLREAMRNVLPKELYKKEKFAFMAPPSHTSNQKRTAIEDLVGQFLNPRTIENTGLFDVERVSQFLAMWRGSTEAAQAFRNDIVLNHLLGIHLLHQQFLAS